MIARRDKLLLAGVLLLVLCLIAVLAKWSPGGEDDAVSSYGTNTHGAKAAYLLLGESGYTVGRWTRPIGAMEGGRMTLIMLEPEDTGANRRAVRAVLAGGGRVLATGLGGAAVLPGGSAAVGNHGPEHLCRATATGAGPLSGARVVEMTTAATWTGSQAGVSHRCEGLASVVRYAVGAGQVVWWASPLPLENGALAREDDLELLLASVGPFPARVVWDEAPAAVEAAPSL